ncbi:MAG TPA: prepilin-type N-terminal cleavage/methylation domain-containing protein [Polyangiales bacterium]|nr:prepilin-type N-terminal cleavage/methylation domain-containing protein [Polyangiales bacterium]
MSRSRAGFTVVELMIALTCGGIAISSMYMIGAASMRTFRAQDRVATTQSSLRSAMAQVKRDFQRAGFLGTPNVNMAGERCTAPVGVPLNDESGGLGVGRLAAISEYVPGVTAADGGFEDLDPEKLNTWNRIDNVILSGNYLTSGEYMGVIVAAAGTSLTVPFTTQGFTRDFTHWYSEGGTRTAGSCDGRALANTFAAGRLLRVHALSELNAFVAIRSASCDTTNNVARINLNETIPGNCNATGGWISPVNFIRYSVKNATGDEASRVGKNRVAVLRRTEVDPNNKATALVVTDDDGTTHTDDRAVLDYVVHFRVDFLMRGSNVNSIDFMPASQASVAANPERVRGAIIELGARTTEHEPDMAVQDMKVAFPPFRVYGKAGDDTPGAARTRVLRAELLLPNLANEGY